MNKKEIEPAVLFFPNPIVLVTSQGLESKPNIITIAWTGVVNSRPPMIGISIQPIRHSHGLIRQSGQFGVNIPNRDLLRAIDYCGFVSGKNTDKFAATGLTPVLARKIKAPLIKECPVNLECVLRHFISLGMHDLFIGEIVSIYVDEQVLDDKGKLDSSLLDPAIYFSQPADYWSKGERVGIRGFTKGHIGGEEQK
jgi:flavin reductase (DIM6/NTAB) family NADH-FMN oxidoreductase RutF